MLWRRIIMWAVFAMIVLLAGLSVAGAFIGVERARAMFNSLPLVVFWFLLLGLFVVGLYAYKRLPRSPGLLSLHLGGLLILCGAMYGSDTGHNAAAKLFNISKIPFGYMRIYEGHASNTISDKDGHEVGRLPFSIALEDFWIEYYEVHGPAMLGITAPPLEGNHEHRQEVIEWTVGETVEIPFVEARVKVLQYLEAARPAYAEGVEGILDITEPDGKKSSIPAEIGQSITLPGSQDSLRIVEVFTHLTVKDGEVINLEGSNANPALRMEHVRPDGTKSSRYAFTRDFYIHRDMKLQMRYVLPGIVGAEPDPDSGLPAMEVLVSHKGKELRDWLIVRDPESPDRISLAALLGGGAVEADEHGHVQRGPSLVLARRSGQISDYKSKLAVIEETREMIKKVIEVNDPLHYGGYHFYQHSYDDQRGQFTVLSVRSDSGLLPVYAGFTLLCVGTFWLMWGVPAWKYLTKRGEHVS